MNHLSLFSGIGGFDLAAEWMGWNNIAHCELNPFGRRVLKYYWPNSISYENIKTTDFSIHRGTIDILTGGFPCQPYSTAGKRLGKEDDRHLWPEMLRAIREIQPRWIVGENVRGLTNWNGGVVFDEVQSDLEVEGYEITPFLLPACAVNAPHRRDRIWFVAYANGFGLPGGCSKPIPNNEGQPGGRDTKANDANPESNRLEGYGEYGIISEIKGKERAVCLSQGDSGNGIPTDTYSGGRQRQGRPFDTLNPEAHGDWKASWSVDDGRWPIEPPVCSRNDGLSSKLSGISLSNYRTESVKALGNSVVPQVVHQIFKAIQQYENL